MTFNCWLQITHQNLQSNLTNEFKLSRGEICVANLIPPTNGASQVIFSEQKFQKWLFLSQKQANNNCGGTQTCKPFFEMVTIFEFMRDEVKKYKPID